MNSEGIYHIDDGKDLFTFRTSSFTVDRGSILHSGIFNRELASSLAAGALTILAGFFFVDRVTTTRAFIALLLFIFLFLSFRTLVFREPVLELTFDRQKGRIGLSVRKSLGTRQMQISSADVAGVRIGENTFDPENIDGVKVIEKIALQHHTVMPGLGERRTLYAVELVLRSGNCHVVFSTEAADHARDVADKLNHAIERC
ncbi:MAG TPA: hypothetical protein VN260_10105 [Dissulfurispiraceae bacterium]|nr:hypothetical protein [Dissulfurispiraceae bacterium]